MPRKVSTTRAAQELGITSRRVAQLCASGVLKSTRIGEKGWLKVELPDKKQHENPQRSN